jgi:hypothetical protein
MKVSGTASCLAFCLIAGSASAADFGYPAPVYAPPGPRAATVLQPVPIVRQEVIVEKRRIVAPPVQVIEQRTVRSPSGVVKTTRIYERYGDPGYAPRPPRDIPFASAPYRAVVAPYGLGGVYASPHSIGTGSPLGSELEEDFE